MIIDNCVQDNILKLPRNRRTLKNRITYLTFKRIFQSETRYFSQEHPGTPIRRERFSKKNIYMEMYIRPI